MHEWFVKLYLIVNGDTIGPADTDIDQDSPLRAIQTRPFNTGILTPLRPEQVATHKNTELTSSIINTAETEDNCSNKK